MSFDLSSITKGAPERAPLIVIHGTPGIGKTTLAASAPNPIFIRTEDGLGNLSPDTFPLCETYEDVEQALAALYGDHDFDTLVVDSISALEALIWDKVAKDNNVEEINEIGYGKGYKMSDKIWRQFLTAAMGLTKRGMTVIMIGHSEVAKMDPPDMEKYSRYQLKLHKRAFEIVRQEVDVIGFAHVSQYVDKEKGSLGAGKAREKSHKGRQLRIVDTPAVVAKNRYGSLDNPVEEIPLTWDALAAQLPQFATTTTTTEEQ